MEANEHSLVLKEHNGEPVLAASYSQISTFQQCPMKWRFHYIDGIVEEEKQEALCYGSAIHKTMELLFKNNKSLTGQRLMDELSFNLKAEDVPWTSPASMLEKGRDAFFFVQWVSDAVEGKLPPKFDEHRVGDLLRRGIVAGAEEPFWIPFPLERPAEVMGRRYNVVWLNGSIDLHLIMRVRSGDYHYVLDWKSGAKPFDEKKLQTDLQHPIYAMYIKRMYGVMPHRSLYFFTRTLFPQIVTVDTERMKNASEAIKTTFNAMYALDGNNETSKVPHPSPLCYYCEYGKYRKGICPYSSDWDPSMKRNK